MRGKSCPRGPTLQHSAINSKSLLMRRCTPVDKVPLSRISRDVNVNIDIRVFLLSHDR